MKMLIFWFSCGILATVPVYFVVNKVYKDGVIGRWSLLTISFGAWSFILDATIGGTEYDMLNKTVLIVLCFAVFLCWHLWRFHTRVLKQRPPVPVGLTIDRRMTPDRRFAEER